MMDCRTAISIDQTSFREAMRKTASGVSVITTSGPAGSGGLTVSTLSSLSMEPPSIIVCINGNNSTLPLILENGTFAASILAAEQSKIADVFAGAVAELRSQRFSVGAWETHETGSPILKGALCGLDCKLVQAYEFGSHHIVIGEVVAVSVANDADEPLIHANRRYRRLLPA